MDKVNPDVIDRCIIDMREVTYDRMSEIVMLEAFYFEMAFAG